MYNLSEIYDQYKIILNYMLLKTKFSLLIIMLVQALIDKNIHLYPRLISVNQIIKSKPPHHDFTPRGFTNEENIITHHSTFTIFRRM